jgi:hypothetical protein
MDLHGGAAPAQRAAGRAPAPGGGQQAAPTAEPNGSKGGERGRLLPPIVGAGGGSGARRAGAKSEAAFAQEKERGFDRHARTEAGSSLG